MARSFAEAILRGLAGAGEELGDELEQNQMFNIQRGDRMKRFRADDAWRQNESDRRRFESDRAYNFDVDQSNQNRSNRLSDIDRRYTMDMMDKEWADRQAAKEAAESARRFDLNYGLDERQEDRLSLSTKRKFVSPAAKFMGALPKTAPMADRRVAQSQLLGGPTIQAVQAAGAQPGDYDAQGRAKYEDWDQLTPEEKQQIISMGFPD